jgi:hypothetical protein
MKHLGSKAALRLASFAVAIGSATPAFAWLAQYQAVNKWTIVCANGNAFTYSGSSAGLDIVGPGLCPNGISAPNGDLPRGVQKGLDAARYGGITPSFLQDLYNLKEIGESAPQARAKFPPNDYPCIDCVPCPKSPKNFCSTTGSVLIWRDPSSGMASGKINFSPLTSPSESEFDIFGE